MVTFESAHPYFHHSNGAYNQLAVIGTKREYDDFCRRVIALRQARRRDPIMGMRLHDLVLVHSPYQAQSVKFEQILILSCPPEKMEFLNWLRFLHDPTEGLITKKTHIIVVE